MSVESVSVLSYLTDGVGERLKGACVSNVEVVVWDGEPMLRLSFDLAEPIDIGDAKNVHGLVMEVLRDPEGNGPGALGLFAVYFPIMEGEPR